MSNQARRMCSTTNLSKPKNSDVKSKFHLKKITFLISNEKMGLKKKDKIFSLKKNLNILRFYYALKISRPILAFMHLLSTKKKTII